MDKLIYETSDNVVPVVEGCVGDGRTGAEGCGGGGKGCGGRGICHLGLLPPGILCE